MRYFDRISPKACRSCFTWNGQNWIQTEPGLCDECDYMLDMFPLIDGNKERERKAPPNCRGRQDAPGVDADGWRRDRRKVCVNDKKGRYEKQRLSQEWK